MKAGRTMTSRDSQDVRHIAAARHARSGRPRWKNDATRPALASATTRTLAPAKKLVSGGSGMAPLRAATSAAYTARNRPWAAPASVVKRITDHAGFMRLQGRCWRLHAGAGAGTGIRQSSPRRGVVERRLVQ